MKHKCIIYVVATLSVVVIVNASTNLTPSEMKKMLDAHNMYRSRVVPSASNMRLMTWDSSVATLAQRKTDKCIYGHGTRVYHPKYGPLGENIYITSGKLPSATHGVDRSVFLWYKEKKNYDYNKRVCNPVNTQCMHYTQMAWANSHILGCGIKYCKAPVDINGRMLIKGGGTIIFCEYAPAGNIQSGFFFQTGLQQDYAKGPWCSACPASANHCVKNLCATASEAATASTTAAAPTTAVSAYVSGSIKLIGDTAFAAYYNPPDGKYTNPSGGSGTGLAIETYVSSEERVGHEFVWNQLVRINGTNVTVEVMMNSTSQNHTITNFTLWRRSGQSEETGEGNLVVDDDDDLRTEVLTGELYDSLDKDDVKLSPGLERMVLVMTSASSPSPQKFSTAYFPGVETSASPIRVVVGARPIFMVPQVYIKPKPVTTTGVAATTRDNATLSPTAANMPHSNATAPSHTRITTHSMTTQSRENSQPNLSATTGNTTTTTRFAITNAAASFLPSLQCYRCKAIDARSCQKRAKIRKCTPYERYCMTVEKTNKYVLKCATNRTCQAKMAENSTKCCSFNHCNKVLFTSGPTRSAAVVTSSLCSILVSFAAAVVGALSWQPVMILS